MNIKNNFSLGFLIFTVLFLASCSNGGSSSVTGHFVDDRVEGLVYHCSSGDFHETDANGEFTCPNGDNVTFYLGANQLGPVPAVSSLITPYTLFPDDPVAAINLARLLQSIDMDGDPNNGVIVANAQLVASLPGNIDFSSPTFDSVIEGVPGIHLVSAEQAQTHLDESIAEYVAEFQLGGHVPVASAGSDQSVNTGDTVFLNGSGSSDADGDTLTYSWGMSKPPTSSASIADWFNNISPTFVPDVAGVYEIILMVSDGVSTHSDNIVITVSDSSDPGISNDADLLALSLTSTLPADTLSPTFDSNIISYTATVDNVYSWISITPTASDSNAAIVIVIPDRTIPVNSGASSGTIGLDVGDNLMSVVVTTEAGNTKTYSLTVTRLAVVTGVPVAPQGLQAIAADSEVTLSWNTVSGATNYTVYWNTTGSVSTTDASINTGSNIQFPHTNLTNDTTYYYRVVASNATGDSVLSSQVSATPVAPVPGVPAAPQGVQATAGDTEVALSWNTTSGATSYKVYWNTTGSVSTSDASINAGSNTQIPHTSLTNNTTYYYRVAASNASGESVLSSEVSATPVAASTEVPAAPLSLQATADDAQITLSWDAATGADSYAVYWTDTGVFSPENSMDIGNNTQYTLTGLTNGTRYFCRVYAINSIGQTSSNVVSATPEIPVPLVFQAIAGDGQTELSWDAVGTQTYNYKVYWSTSSNVSTLDNSLDAGTSTQILHTGLSSGAIHYYRVSATGAAGEGELSSRISSAQPNTWQWANPEPQGNSIEALVWGNNQFVAVGPAGSVLTSSDGSNWTIQSAGTASDLSDIAWNGSRFVAVGEGAIITSADGITWSAQSSGSIYSATYSITWNGSLFVAVGYNTILTSPDGVAWTRRTITSSGWLRHVTWGGSQFVIYEYPGNILTSADGISWSKYTDVVSNLSSIVWDGGRFVATGFDGVITSPDGVTWTDTGATSSVGSLIWDGSRYVGIGQAGLISSSTDALNWTTQVSNTTERLAAIAWNGSQYVAGGSSGTILSSPDVVNWTQRMPLASVTTESLNDIVWNGSQFVVVGRTGTILTSPDGDTWTSQDSGVTSLSLESINWNGSQYMVVGSDFLTSPDGVNWTIRDAGTSAGSVVWDGSQYVVVGAYKKTLTSPDGINWTTHDITSTVGFNAVAWNGSLFVAVGGYNAGYNIMTSPDGITWTANTNLFSRLDDVIWANNQFVASGQGGRTLTSPDGLIWTSHYEIESSSGYLINVEWDGSQYVLSSAEGHIYTSADGVNWARQNTGSGGWISSITWNDAGKAVAVGLFGAILTNSAW